MANAIKVSREIADATGVALPTVENIARRLGEGGWLPRGGRGRHAAQFGPTDIATLLVGVMAIAGDALETPASHVRAAVERISELSIGGPLTIDTYFDDAGRRETVPGGAFIANVASFIEWPELRIDQVPMPLDDNHAPTVGRILALGLQFGGGTVVGWIETAPDPSANNVARRTYFGMAREVTSAGMVREVRVSVDVLDRLGGLLDQQDERQADLPLAPTSAGDQQTRETARLPEATAPSDREAHQPGVRPADNVNTKAELTVRESRHQERDGVRHDPSLEPPSKVTDRERQPDQPGVRAA